MEQHLLDEIDDCSPISKQKDCFDYADFEYYPTKQDNLFCEIWVPINLNSLM